MLQTDANDQGALLMTDEYYSLSPIKNYNKSPI